MNSRGKMNRNERVQEKNGSYHDMRTIANCFPVKINISISWWQVISEIDEPWMDKVTRFVRYGMAWRGKAYTARGRSSAISNWKEEVVYPGKKNGEIRGEVNRSHKPDRVAVCVFLGTRRRRAGRPQVLLAPDGLS
jgi:hypothetical protein